MSRCLPDRTLLSMYDGEATIAHQAHLQTCTACAARYRQLIQDLEVIGQALQKAPPSRVNLSRSCVVSLRWVPVAAALAVVLVWAGIWIWRPARQTLSPVASSEDILQFVEKDIAPALFPLAKTRVATLPVPVSDLTYVQAALDGEWPCERREPFLSAGCEIYPFPLLMGEQ